MKKMKYHILALALLLSCGSTFGQRAFDNNLVHYTDTLGDVYIDIPLLTLPAQYQAYNTTGGFFSSYMNPGMENSLSYSTDLYTAAHFGLKKAIRFKNNTFMQIFTQRLAISAFDVLVMQMPLGVSWLHEEYHRGVMTQYGVNSYNEVLLFKLGSGTIAVSHETDEDMVMLCNQHHPDFVRLMSAGHEGVVDLNRNLQHNQFFYHQNLDNEVLYWMHSFQNILYLMTCANGTGEDNMAERNRIETSVEMRDFTGLDMNAWIHALCNPDLPYEARGTHPSGVGINRYISYNDISDEGKDYLHRQAGLDILNFVSPMMFGFSRFRLANDYYGNFAFRHYLTAFGDDASLDLYLQTPRHNIYTTLHSYNNFEHHFGGLEVGLVDFRLSRHLCLSGTLMGWLQPKDMSFYTATGSFGGLAKARANYSIANSLDAYLEMGWKSNGWVAGNANLNDGFFLRTGLRWQIEKGTEKKISIGVPSF
ncbi:MAG: hypothetical protein IKX51_07945 [Bacteroidales bacterium]|nr:hypothetical protein [Bacteroidales bacterium]